MPRRSGPRREPEPHSPDKPPALRRRPPLTAQRLRARFLVHIARQIDRFDAALDAEAAPSGFNSAKVLRDLRGLKALLDEVKAEEAGHDAVAPSVDLVALRADIARRYAAFEAHEPDGALSGEPAPDASPGP